MHATILVALSLVLSPAPGVCRQAPPPEKPNGQVLLPPPPKPKAEPARPARKKLENRTALQIDTGSLGEDGKVLGQRVRAKTEAELQNISLLQGEGPELPVVQVKITALPGDAIGWAYTLDIHHAETAPIPGGSLVGECVDCTESELVDRVAGDVRSLLPRLRAYIVDYNAKIDAEAKSAADPGGAVEGPKDQPPAEPTGPREQPGMLPMCKAGIGLMVGGVVVAGVGIGLAVKPDAQPDPNIGWETQSTKVPGFVTIGLGGAVALTGALLFALGHRKSQRAGNTALVPSLSPTAAGLMWSGRF